MCARGERARVLPLCLSPPFHHRWRRLDDSITHARRININTTMLTTPNNKQNSLSRSWRAWPSRARSSAASRPRCASLFLKRRGMGLWRGSNHRHTAAPPTHPTHPHHTTKQRRQPLSTTTPTARLPVRPLGRLLPPAARVRRLQRGGGGREARRPYRRLHEPLQADARHDQRPRGAHAHEADRGGRLGPRRRLPHVRARARAWFALLGLAVAAAACCVCCSWVGAARLIAGRT